MDRRTKDAVRNQIPAQVVSVIPGREHWHPHTCLIHICKLQKPLGAEEKHAGSWGNQVCSPSVPPFKMDTGRRAFPAWNHKIATKDTTLWKTSQESEESICWFVVSNSSLKQLIFLSPSLTSSPKWTEAQLAKVPERHLLGRTGNLNMHKLLNCLHGYISERHQRRVPTQDCSLAGRLASSSHRLPTAIR